MPDRPPLLGDGGQVPVAERRVCSVLFADLVGFTPFAESRDPEDVREILSRYFDIARTVVARHGGIIEKFIGDAVMAVWGTPIATEQDAERSVRAALELLAGVERLGAEAGVPLEARAGVVTGEVAVTLGAQGQGMAAGDAVNTAARVEGAASPGTVLVDEKTRRLAEAAIAFSDEGAFELKGKARPEHLYRATRVLSLVGGAGRGANLEAPFIGRDSELRAVKDMFHTSVGRRAPRLLVVVGPAGAGKSRLLWEFYKYVDGLADPVLWHHGRCLSYGEGIAYWALAEIVRQRFGIGEDDPTEIAASKLEEGMRRFIDDEAERSYVGVRLSRLLGVPYPAQADAVLGREELYAGWRLFFEHLAQAAPVVLVVDDGHHADPGLLAFFEHLVDWTRQLPIFVLLATRAASGAVDASYGVGRNRATVRLDELDSRSMGTIVEALVPGIDPAVREAVTARAEGIPLFAVETVRSLIDQGVVAKDAGGTYRLAGRIDQLVVPDSLHALLAARLDALPSALRSLTAVASVLGTSFPKEALVAVSGRDDGALEACLAELIRRDVLEIFADPLSPERGTYRFEQDMLRHVAYETLSRKDRVAYHLRVAEHLRSAFPNDGEEIADVIARHYRDARAASPPGPEADALGSQARAFLLRAAERAERSGAPTSAADSYEAAAAISEPEAAGELLEQAAHAALTFGDHRRAQLLIDQAIEHHGAVGTSAGVARSRSYKGRVLVAAGRLGAARAELTEALSALRANPDTHTVNALRRLGTLEVLAGNLASGEALIDEAFQLLQCIEADPVSIATLFDSKGVAALFGNRLIEAAAYSEMAAVTAQRAGNLSLAAVPQHNLADILARTDPARAAEVARSAADYARRTGRRDALALAVANLAIALLELGRWDEAESALREVDEVDHIGHADVARLLGWLAGLRGDATGVAAALDRLAESRSTEEPQTQASIGYLEALGALSRGDLQAALGTARAVLEKSEAIGIGHESMRWAWPLAIRVARGLDDREAFEHLVALLSAHPSGHLPPVLRAGLAHARALDGTGDLTHAIALLRAAGNPYHLAHGLIDWAEVTSGADTNAKDLLAEARVIAASLKCPPLLVRAAGGAPQPVSPTTASGA